MLSAYIPVVKLSSDIAMKNIGMKVFPIPPRSSKLLDAGTPKATLCGKAYDRRPFLRGVDEVVYPIPDYDAYMVTS